jgi:subtilisin family serine protease
VDSLRRGRTLGGSSRRARRALSLGLSALLVALFVPISAASGQPGASRRPGAGGRLLPRSVRTASDQARHKLGKDLLLAYDRHAAGSVPVFVSVVGDAAGVARQLRNSRATRTGATSLVVGTVDTDRLVKLAGGPDVVSVRPVIFRKDGTPTGVLERRRPRLVGARRTAAAAAVRSSDVSFSEAPAPRGSTFDTFKRLNVLDARTHNFTEAWKQGITGEGTTVAVFDGGSDWGHPDLIGAKIARDASGWPVAFDPFGTMQWLLAPKQIDQGLSWYVRTTPATCGGSGGTCRVAFATRTGPSRNFAAPTGTRTHTYSFPRAWSKSGRARLGSHPDDYTLALFGERPAFLVTDANQAGVYDTVYVDLNGDFDFGDEKPVTRQSPRSWRDLDGDGFVDLSGGLLYYVSDGKGAGGRAVPGGLEAFGAVIKGDPGEIAAWTGDFDPAVEGHGTLCASNIVGQGVTNGTRPAFTDLPGGKYPSAVVGGAPHATMVPFGDIYFNFDFSTQFAYLLANSVGIDVTSNSYGSSDVDNDGLDAASQEADIWHTAYGGRTTSVFSTGNGGPGFGTTTPPAPVTGVKVGASTQYGATGWDSVTRYRQVTDNDIANWSNRGPGSGGGNGVDLVANGAYAAGATTTNLALLDGLDGRHAWQTWGGTSRSTPVVVGATALVYQAYRASHSALPEGFSAQAKRFLKSAATDLRYDTFIQGAGSLNAGRAVRLAKGGRASSPGATVSPAEWRPGSYRGEQFEAFPHLLAPGQRASQRFQLSGPGSYAISDRVLRRTAVERFDFTTSNTAREQPFLFNAPNYLIDITRLVKKHAKADLMVIRASYPYHQFDPDNDLAADQAWRMLTFNWTDANHDGRLWSDRDHDGTVDNFGAERATIDGDPRIDRARSEIETGEYVRFTYVSQTTNAYTNMVRSPASRMADGVFLGFSHFATSTAIPRTSFRVEIEFYSSTDFSWVSTPRRASGSFTATIEVPSGTPFGQYSGAVVVSGRGQRTVVPVAVTVAATARQDAQGQLTGALGFGGARVDRRQRDRLYNNGSVLDAKDWGWRADAGDWRFFYYDVPRTPPAGTQFLARTTFAGPAPHNDLDTLIFGRTVNSYQLVDGSAPVFAPYALGTVGASQNTNVGEGVWRFHTATGGPQELVSAPAQEGLHAVVQHQVNFQHDSAGSHIPFRTTVAGVNVAPSRVSVTTGGDAGSFDVTFTSGIGLDGLRANAFGLSQPSVTSRTAHQDDPDDPSAASVKVPFTVSHAGHVTVTTALAAGDVDLYVVRDANGDGHFTSDEIVGASAGSSGNESVQLSSPPDGSYQVWAHGFGVSGSPAFPLTIDAVQGDDLAVSGLPTGPVAASTPVTLRVAFSKPMVSGQDYSGELRIGPTVAPGLVTVPISVHRR